MTWDLTRQAMRKWADHFANWADTMERDLKGRKRPVQAKRVERARAKAEILKTAIWAFDQID